MLLGVQIETSSGAHAPEVLSVRSDSMIYGGGRVVCVEKGGTDAADQGMRGWRSGGILIRKLDIWRVTALLVSAGSVGAAHI